MFYKMIEAKCRQWLSSDICTVRSLIDYICSLGQMRDAQVEAIKTYLFLKIACGCKPLSRLFAEGAFNTLNLDTIELSRSTRSYLESHPAAASLFEYATLKDDTGEQVSTKLEKQIRKAPERIHYDDFFKTAFYGVSYTDYLFSLPMGAGKTYLMAAFIYLDLYFAWNEPNNPAFAHNFMIFAPSGLKSSVVPSLKTIQNFNPAWVIPEPAASELKRMISFEVLDQQKTASKSNKTKNPNVQKIASHQPLSELFGLVAVTNAEKVILDRVQDGFEQLSMEGNSEDEKDRQANELRNLIGKLPSLSIFIDEVHHAVRDEIKLRAVVNRWADNRTINSVVGFSGTPFLEKPEKIAVTDALTVSTAEITNIVYYYPLVDGIGNFLKRPVVKITSTDVSSRIIENGVREFLDTYGDKTYANGLTAKLGIYCGTIEKLENTVYPLVSRIADEYGLPNSCILRFHRGNKAHPQPGDCQMQFDTLDTPQSGIRIILLVQIGKEGWDCRSLTGIILSQVGDCPKNMVLQTSCRCLRQVDKHAAETALICLNSENGDKLQSQLQQQQHISLKEFTETERRHSTLKRYDRTKHLRLPPIAFYQLRVQYESLVLKEAKPEQNIMEAPAVSSSNYDIEKTTDFSSEVLQTRIDDSERGTSPATFLGWLNEIAKGSFGTLSPEQLLSCETSLRSVYQTITYESDGQRYFSSRYDRNKVNVAVRKAFADRRTFTTQEELIPQKATLLNIAHFTTSVETSKPEDYYPEQSVVQNIIQDDKGKYKRRSDIEATIQALEETGNHQLAENLRRQFSPHPRKDHSFHYLPYHTDSPFEQTFLREVLTLSEIEDRRLEVYYNGDRALTEFKIKCYRTAGKGWTYVGMYTPDFLILQRRDGEIYKALIVETKGKIYANDPAFKAKRSFVESEFIRQNNEKFGYERFEYLYLEDTQSEAERLTRSHDLIVKFFEV